MKIVHCEECGREIVYQWKRGESMEVEEDIISGLCQECFGYWYYQRIGQEGKKGWRWKTKARVLVTYPRIFDLQRVKAKTEKDKV